MTLQHNAGSISYEARAGGRGGGRGARKFLKGRLLILLGCGKYSRAATTILMNPPLTTTCIRFDNGDGYLIAGAQQFKTTTRQLIALPQEAYSSRLNNEKPYI